MKHCFLKYAVFAAALFFCASGGVIASGLTTTSTSAQLRNETHEVNGINYVAWQYAQIPADNFLSDATSAEITVKGAVFVAFGYQINPWNYLDYSEGVFNWSESNVAGVTFTISGDILESAKNGGLYIRTNTSEGLTMSINNICGNNTSSQTPTEPEVIPTEPDETPPEPEVTPTEPTPATPTEPEVKPTEPEEKPDKPVNDEKVYGILSSYEMKLSEWNNIQIPAGAFSTKATDVKMVISGASCVKYIVCSDVVAEYPWSDNTKFGAILNLSPEQIAEAQKGNLYAWVGGGTPITLTVSCYGMGGTPEKLRDPETLDLTNFGDRSYAISHRYQLTDVPTLYLTVPDAEGKDINTVLFKDRATNTADYHAVTVQVVDKKGCIEEFTDDGEIKVRGNSTSECIKRPYRIKFPKKHKHDMVGNGYDARNWVLLANYLDPAMIRNAVSYHIGKEVGMEFCPGYQFADVVINDEYRGTYQITDQVEVGKNRINVDEDNGWYIEASRYDMVEEPCLTVGNLPLSIKNPEPSKEAEIAELKAQVEQWFTNLNNVFFNSDFATFTSPSAGWRAYLDEESLVNFYIGVNIAGDYDGFMTIKMFRETDGKMHFGPLWDKDLSAGNYEDGTKLIEEYNNGAFVNYINKLLTDPVFVKNVQNRLAALVVDGIEKNLQNYVSLVDSKIAKTEPLNSTKWEGYASWKHSFTSHAAAIQQLKDYYKKHVSFVVSKIDEKVAAFGNNAKSFATTSISKIPQSTLVKGGKGNITVISCNDREISIYSLTGIEVARASTGVTVTLPSGTYVVDGHKVIVE